MIEEYNSSNVLQADYVMGSRIDEPLTMTRSSTTYYYNTDGLGNIRQVLNSSGTIVESYDYDPYGQVTIYNSSLTDITSSGSGIDNPYMFTGRRFDEEMDIYHYRARQYDPGIGRFLQRDPLGYFDSMNLFEYVVSNPVNYIDPFGLGWQQGSTPPGSWPQPPENVVGRRPKWDKRGFWKGKGREIHWDNRSHGTGHDRGDGPQDGHWDDNKSDDRWDRDGNLLPITPEPVPTGTPPFSPAGSPGGVPPFSPAPNAEGRWERVWIVVCGVVYSYLKWVAPFTPILDPY